MQMGALHPFLFENKRFRLIEVRLREVSLYTVDAIMPLLIIININQHQ